MVECNYGDVCIIKILRIVYESFVFFLFIGNSDLCNRDDYGGFGL